MSAPPKALRLDDKIFVPVENTDNGTVSGQTRFHFWQKGKVFFADYVGGDVSEGHIIGKLTGDFSGEMLYHCLTKDGRLKAGQASAVFSEMEDGRLAIDIEWEWLTENKLDADDPKGTSRYEEVLDPFNDELGYQV